MKVFNDSNSETGLTLLEVLLSIVILSVVVIGLLGFFAQTILLSSRVEDRMTALNIAEEVLLEYKLNKEYQEEVIINNKTYYSRVFELDNTSSLGLTPLKVEVYSMNDFSSSSYITGVYGYFEEDEE
ncbi:type IV pilus modification PilV family protein [Sutcliffiella sp. NC1]|uniref:type IV pilus modification PilV family protein n=1 Tax=Sutcliffiella sp. NC1 TaxID=3004096 RepID=UPI0022DD93DE|nr:prepilin-type N-terminal cleavage/methylation domain-containing protein [Sutcliffiella sp. NC1]WBL14002.1 prepilin-type N-terminal cleavage/methylation domain-containing protein [Sutcliffiella sp. NC1]